MYRTNWPRSSIACLPTATGMPSSKKAWWNNRLKNEQAWKVSAADIKARNYNLDIKNPHSPDAVVHDPDELLADYAALQVKIGETRAKLKDVLSAALQGED